MDSCLPFVPLRKKEKAVFREEIASLSLILCMTQRRIIKKFISIQSCSPKNNNFLRRSQGHYVAISDTVICSFWQKCTLSGNLLLRFTCLSLTDRRTHNPLCTKIFRHAKLLLHAQHSHFWRHDATKEQKCWLHLTSGGLSTFLCSRLLVVLWLYHNLPCTDSIVIEIIDHLIKCGTKANSYRACESHRSSLPPSGINSPWR